MRLLVAARHKSENGRDRMDDTQNTVAEAQRWSSPGIRQAQVGDENGNPNRAARPTRPTRPRTFVRGTLSILVSHSTQHFAGKGPARSRVSWKVTHSFKGRDPIRFLGPSRKRHFTCTWLCPPAPPQSSVRVAFHFKRSCLDHGGPVHKHLQC